jgi:3-oxoacyl-[acyl-carrier-protein] synthase III
MIRIAGVSFHVPDRVVSNDEIIAEGQLKIRAATIEKMIGVRERRWVTGDTAASDLAVAAIKKLGLPAFGGSLFVSTISQDYLTPSTASVIKRKLDWTHSGVAIDLNAACAGLLVAIDLAHSRLRTSEETEALVVATEVRSRFLDRRDRRTAFLFGDGACAIHLRKQDAGGSIEWIHTASPPSETTEILVPAGGSAHPASASTVADGLHTITMVDGPKIVESTTVLLVDWIRQVLKDHGATIADFDYAVFHQGNAFISRKLCEALGIPVEKTWANFARYGNTSSASLGIALAEAHECGKLRRGDRVLVVAMGAGYHIGIGSLRWGP